MVVFMPLYEDLKFPASAMMITKKLINIATFDLLETEWLNDLVWFFPDDVAFSANFDTVGINSTHYI